MRGMLLVSLIFWVGLTWSPPDTYIPLREFSGYVPEISNYNATEQLFTKTSQQRFSRSIPKDHFINH